MGNPQDNLKFIHIGGTNGKGSTCTMVSQILTEAGYKTGLFTSPFLKFFNERIKINGIPISNSDLADIASYVKNMTENMTHLYQSSLLTLLLRLNILIDKTVILLFLKLALEVN